MSDVSFDHYSSSSVSYSRSRRGSSSVSHTPVAEVVSPTVVKHPTPPVKVDSSSSLSSASKSSPISSHSSNHSSFSSESVLVKARERSSNATKSCTGSTSSSYSSITAPHDSRLQLSRFNQTNPSVNASELGVVRNGIRTIEVSSPADLFLAVQPPEDLSSSDSNSENKSIISGIDLLRSMRRKKTTPQTGKLVNTKQSQNTLIARPTRRNHGLQRRKLPNHVSQKGILESYYEELQHLVNDKQLIEDEVESIKTDVRNIEMQHAEARDQFKEAMETRAAIVGGQRQSQRREQIATEQVEIQKMKIGIEKYKNKISSAQNELSEVTQKTRSSSLAILDKSVSELVIEIRGLKVTFNAVSEPLSSPSHTELELSRHATVQKKEKLEEIKSKMDSVIEQCAVLEDVKKSYYEKFQSEQEISAANQANLLQERHQLRFDVNYVPPELGYIRAEVLAAEAEQFALDSNALQVTHSYTTDIGNAHQVLNDIEGKIERYKLLVKRQQAEQLELNNEISHLRELFKINDNDVDVSHQRRELLKEEEILKQQLKTSIDHSDLT